ncbi:hypothetical protein WIW50_17435 [Flavobacteriaceae bacterium 3-367]|uniref:hypothetical protein n=1 Tax=Eudoraea algarum TaxID=3417568 RepID=UPI00328029B9
MKRITIVLGVLACTSLSFLSGDALEKEAHEGTFIYGTPNIRSMSKLTFGPDGILFLGDSKGASVYAFDFKDDKKPSSAAPIDIRDIDQKIGALLGRPRKDILIHDLAVNPISQNIYCTVSYGGSNSRERDIFDPNYLNDATLLMKISPQGKISEVSLEGVYYNQLKLSGAFTPSAKWRSGRSKNTATIRYLVYDNGQLYISGLSNEEFSSTFRVAQFPFDQQHSTTGVEFYHGAHGQYETSSPINTFIKYQINGQQHLLAAYSCTPLITIPLVDLRDGGKIRARTVAEIGPGSHPIDIRTYRKKGEEYILIANSKRGLIQMRPADLAAQRKSINYPTSRAGVHYKTLIPGSHIRQMDNLNENYVVLLTKNKREGFDLTSLNVNTL